MIVNTDKSVVLSSLYESKISDLVSKAAYEPFVFRKKLNFSSLYSFGNEIEVNNMFKNENELLVEKFNDKHSLFDDDKFVIHDEPTADAEIATPILTNQQYDWCHLKSMYEELIKCEAEIGNNTASHIHVGTHFINTPEKLALLLKTLVVFQPIIYKFGYGYGDKPRDFIVASYDANNHCMFMTPGRVEKFVDCLEHFNYKSKSNMYQNYYDFTGGYYSFRPVFSLTNFNFANFFYPFDSSTPNYNDHMEIRCFNGTLDPVIVQNNINLIVNILRAVNEDTIDKEYIEREYDRYLDTNRYDFDFTGGFFRNTFTVDDYNKILFSFNEVDLEKAIKLADMIYTTDIDKLLFLKQYLKLFAEKKEVIRSL